MISAQGFAENEDGGKNHCRIFPLSIARLVSHTCPLLYNVKKEVGFTGQTDTFTEKMTERERERERKKEMDSDSE